MLYAYIHVYRHVNPYAYPTNMQDLPNSESREWAYMVYYLDIFGLSSMRYLRLRYIPRSQKSNGFI